MAGDPEGAIEHARKALAANPNYPDAMNWLFNALWALGHYEESYAALEQMLVIDPLTVIGRANYIALLVERRQSEEAHEMADQLLAQSPLWGYFAHADTSLIEGKIAESLYWGLKHGREMGQLGHFAIVAFNLVGEYDEARRDNDDIQAIFVDIDQGNFDDAIRKAQQYLRLNPDNEYAIRTAADAFYTAGHLDEALTLCERMVEFVPQGRPISAEKFPLAWTMRLALARRNAGDEEGAQAAAQIARQDYAARRAAGRKDPEQHWAKAMIAAFEHDRDRAIAALRSAIQHGLRDPLVFDDHIFENLWDEPRFIALQQELDAMLAEEHEKVLQLICFNNPVPDHWQPLPETCEGVVEQGQLF